jgi:DNA mismatch endonuclease (patch repair protein)
MSAIHSKDTVPEITLRKALWANGCRFRVQYSREKIDIAFPAKKVAVFVDGCFWHGCPIHSRKIRTNEAYWNPKLENNKKRDRQKTAQLQAQGWTVLRFWEHELSETETVVNKIQKALQAKVRLSLTLPEHFSNETKDNQ